MATANHPLSVHVDQQGPHDTPPMYPPARAVAEGAGDGVGDAAQPAKGSATKKLVLIVAGLLAVAALIAGVGYLVFLRDDGGDMTSDTAMTDATGSDSATTERNGDVTSTGAESPLSDATGSDDDSAGSGDNTAGSGEEPSAGSDATAVAGAPAAGPTAAATAPVAATVLETIPVNASLGSYDASFALAAIPVAIAVLPSGKVLAWSAESPDDFYRGARYIVGGGGSGKTYFAEWDPSTNNVTGLLVSDTDHDMFCPGITTMPNGDIIVTGGQNADAVSIYQLATGTWVAAPKMSISRGYGSSCLLSDGRVFVLGGSWSGPKDLDKDAEVYDPTLGEWSSLTGIQAADILTEDPEDAEEGFPYRGDNYGMFHSWSEGTVFHAGPSETMLWFSTNGTGSALTAGVRPGGNIANGNSVMFDKGKILNCGGSESFAFEEYPATDVASLITINEPNVQVTVRELSPMALPRVYGNAAVLPDGKVLITGGASNPLEFSDRYAYHQPEIWDPATETFTLLEAEYVYGRTYHSTAALLPDGRVVTGGGGLCGSGKNDIDSLCVDIEEFGDPNHLDFEVFNPPYLFAADGSLAPRPTIEVSAATAKLGSSLSVTSSEPLMMISMIRVSTATHSTNTDQRRIELCGPATTACGASPVTVTVDSDPGVALAGNWMFFGVNAAGAPSVASIVLVGM